RGAAAVVGLRLRFYGQYAEADLRYLLRDVDCVIAPSRVPETGGLAVREALAQGVPVLASRFGALSEVVRDGVNGFTFDPERPSDLADLLRRLAANQSLLDNLRHGARQTPVVTVAQHAAAVRAVYRDAVEELTRNPGLRRADLTEIDFLHRALLAAGADR